MSNIINLMDEFITYAPKAIDCTPVITNWGLSPFFDPSRCVIPISEPKTLKWADMVGKTINLMGAYGLTIESVFVKWDIEWVQMRNDYGLTTRNTKTLSIKDVVN